jgi:hypothetical protein
MPQSSEYLERAAFLVAEEAVNCGKLWPLVEHNPVRITEYATQS